MYKNTSKMFRRTDLYNCIIQLSESFSRNTGGQDDIHSAHFLVAKHQNEEYGNKKVLL